MKRGFILTIGFTAICFAGAATADIISGPINGKVSVVKTAKLAKFVSKAKDLLPPDSTFLLPAPGSGQDPTVGGASLSFVDVAGGVPGGSAGAAAFTLDASGWSGLGDPPGSKGYKYKGKLDVNDPDPKGTCKVVLIKEKVMKAVCKGPLVTLTTPFASGPGATLGLPAGSTGVQYCVEFSASTGAELKKNDVKVTKFKDSAPPVACW